MWLKGNNGRRCKRKHGGTGLGNGVGEPNLGRRSGNGGPLPPLLVPLRPRCPLRNAASPAGSGYALARKSHLNALHMYRVLGHCPSTVFCINMQLVVLNVGFVWFNCWVFCSSTVRLRCTGVHPDEHPIKSELVGLLILWLLCFIFWFLARGCLYFEVFVNGYFYVCIWRLGVIIMVLPVFGC